MRKNVTKDYRKATNEEVAKIADTEKKIAKQLGIDDRVECMPNLESYMQFKDLKVDFQNKQLCRHKIRVWMAMVKLKNLSSSLISILLPILLIIFSCLLFQVPLISDPLVLLTFDLLSLLDCDSIQSS